MLSTTVVHVCLRCGSEKIRKNGHADNGAQRAKCLECGRTFILQPKGARYGQKFKDQVMAAYQGRATRSDYRDAYDATFPKHTHRCCGKAEGETCHVERWFGTLRARLSRLVRRTHSFSKHAENHLDAVHLFITTYNLAILHKTTAR